MSEPRGEDDLGRGEKNHGQKKPASLRILSYGSPEVEGGEARETKRGGGGGLPLSKTKSVFAGKGELYLRQKEGQTESSGSAKSRGSLSGGTLNFYPVGGRRLHMVDKEKKRLRIVREGIRKIGKTTRIIGRKRTQSGREGEEKQRY